MKNKLGKGKAIIVLIFAVIMPFSVYSQELSNKELRAKVDEAQTLFDEKRYNEATKVLTEILESNPERLDQAVDLMDKIVEVRNAYNDKYRELLNVLYVEQDPEKALGLIEELEEIEPFPNEVITQDLRNARISVELVRNRNTLNEQMDIAKGLLDQKNYLGALEVYKGTRDEGILGYSGENIEGLGERTYTSAPETIVSSIDENAVITARDEIYDLAVAFVSEETALVEQINQFGQDIAVIPSGGLLSPMDSILSRLRSLSDTRNEIIEKSGVFSQKLEILLAGTEEGIIPPERFFLDFSNFLVFGRNDTDYFEGILSATDLFWEDQLLSLAGAVNSAMARSYETAISAYDSGNFDSAKSSLDNTRNYAEASIFAYDLLYGRIALSDTLEADEYGSYLIGKYYGDLVDARIYARATESFGSMIELRRGLAGYSLTDDQSIEDLYNLRQSILADLPVIDGEEQLWATISSSINWLESYGAMPPESENVYQLVNRELGNLREDMNGINLAILTRLTDREYNRIVSSLQSYREVYDNSDTLIEGIIDPEVAEYTGNEELLSTFPDRALPLLVSLAEDLDILLAETEEILETFKGSDPDLDTGGKIAEFIEKAELVVPRIVSLSDETDLLETLARDNIFKAEGYEDQGNQLLNDVRTIVSNQRATRESYDRARDDLKNANNAFYQSFTFLENLDLRKRIDNDLASLQQALIDGENRLVVEDVRNFINQGKQAYGNRQYSRARVFLERAQNRHLTTNTEENQEVLYWLALVDLALKFDRGRTINRTEPLYDEVTQFLNLAYSNFYRGVNLLSRGEREAALESFDQAIANIESVETLMPRNEVASFLRLKIAQFTDPDQFRESFSERINDAWQKLLSSDPANQSEGYAELLDLSKIDADYPGLQARITQAEYDILKTRRRPPDPAKVAESNSLYAQALDIVESGNRTSFPIALAQLNKAIELNPENSLAISLKDNLQISSGGQTTLVLPAALLERYNEALELFQQENNLGAYTIILELKKDSRSATYPELLKLEERVKLKLGIP